MSDRMALNEFEHWLDLHGADLRKWPAGRTDAARALLDDSVEARTLLAQGDRVDALLRRVIEARPLPAPQIGRIIAGLPARKAHANWRKTFAPRSIAAAGLVAACLMFGLGAWTAGVVEAQADETDLAALSVDEPSLIGGL
ncbi:hypothetical protein [Flaviflagellibacter deserti]|uniref:Anti-sigma factor n=1 Tax=Flaviflagellibacter deserti TaxID=2267266 RepID=A0ABV9YYB6_9HYPH